MLGMYYVHYENMIPVSVGTYKIVCIPRQDRVEGLYHSHIFCAYCGVTPKKMLKICLSPRFHNVSQH